MGAHIFLRTRHSFRFPRVHRVPFLHHESAKAHICTTWRRQATNSAASRVTKLIFPFLPWTVFGSLSILFQVFLRCSDFGETEPPWAAPERKWGSKVRCWSSILTSIGDMFLQCSLPNVIWSRSFARWATNNFLNGFVLFLLMRCYTFWHLRKFLLRPFIL